MANEDARRFGEEFRRQLKKHQTPRLKSGTITEPADTWDKTVLVRVGTEEVKATYRGAVPHVGDAVEIQRTATGYKVVVQIPPVLLPDSSGTFTVPPEPSGGRPPVNSFAFWGHSYTHSPISGIKGLGNDFTFPWYLGGRIDQMLPWRVDKVLADLLGIDEDKVRHFGVGGAVLLSDEQPAYPVPGLMPNLTRKGWAWVLRHTCAGSLNRYGWAPQQDPAPNPFGGGDLHTHTDSQFGPFMPANTAHVSLYGTNDVGFWGDPNATVDGVPGMILTAWTEANRSNISRWRAGGIVEDSQLYSTTNPKLPYGFTYTGSASTVAATQFNSGTTMTRWLSGSGTIVAHFGADWPGGTVTFRFRGEPGAGGTVTIPGAAAFSTANRMPATRSSIPHPPDTVISSTAYMTVPAWTPSYGVVCRRVPLARTGVAQTITIAINAAAGPVWFDGMDLEQTGMAPPVVIGNTPRPARWSAAYVTSPTWAAHPDASDSQAAVSGGTSNKSIRGTQVTEAGDGWAVTLNTALTALVAEFAEVPDLTSTSTSLTSTVLNSVAVADLYTACDGVEHPELYKPEDSLHPNPAGTAAIAGAFYQGLSLATTKPQGAAALGAA